MPDLKTGLMTYPEFLAAMDGAVGNNHLIFMDINSSATWFMEQALATQNPYFGDEKFVELANFLTGLTTGGDFAGRVGGDLFAFSFKGNTSQAASLETTIQTTSPVPVRTARAPYSGTSLDTVKETYRKYFAENKRRGV
jgi:hypothetical protein